MSSRRPPFKTAAAYVEWVDSMTTNGWLEEGAAEGCMMCVTIGHVVRRTPTTLLMALNRSKYMHGHYIEIPLCAIRKFRKIHV